MTFPETMFGLLPCCESWMKQSISTECLRTLPMATVPILPTARRKGRSRRQSPTIQACKIGIRNAFMVTRLENGRLLIFDCRDCRALDYPVLATMRRLAQEVTFVVLCGAAIYIGETVHLTRAGCEP